MSEMGVVGTDRIVSLVTSEKLHLQERAQCMPILMSDMCYNTFYIGNRARNQSILYRILIEDQTS